MSRKLIDCIAAMIVTAFAFLALLGWADRAMGATAAELPSIAYPSPYLADASTVVFVVCLNGQTGTAVYLGSGRYVTAAHVLIDDKGQRVSCLVDDKLVTVEQLDSNADWALFSAPHYPPFKAIISCERLIEGQPYFATGYAKGNPWPVTTYLSGVAIAQTEAGQRTAAVNGSLVSGMSGGSVADRNGADHAIVDWRDEDGAPVGGVVELADTPLCSKKG